MSRLSVLVLGSSQLETQNRPVALVPSSRETVLQDARNAGGILLTDTDPELLTWLRTQTETRLLPIFTTSPQLLGHPLSDGDFGSTSVDDLETFDRRREALVVDPASSSDALVSAYLFLSETRAISPEPNLAKSKIYHYPVLKALLDGDSSRWLVSAERKGIVEKAGVVDRLRECHSCGGSHLNYVDCCPHCQSLEIETQQSLHCFTCGHVADQDMFRRGEQLACPKCQTTLKHIGTDYDRPIENSHCRDCGERFLEADVRASCLECGTSNAQSDLKTRVYHRFVLGAAGEDLVRNGAAARHVPALGEPVDLGHFQWSLSWANEASGSSPTPASLAILSSPQFAQEASATTEEDLAFYQTIGAQLRGLLRPSDILHLPEPGVACILFPFDGTARVREFARDLEGIQSGFSGSEVEILLKAASLPDPELSKDPARWLRDLLSGETV